MILRRQAVVVLSHVHVPSHPMSIPSPRGMISRDSCLQPDTRNVFGTSGNVFENPPTPKEPTASCCDKCVCKKSNSYSLGTCVPEHRNACCENG